MYILHNMVQNLASGFEMHLSLLLYPYVPSGFGVGFWCLKTFSQGIGSTRDTCTETQNSSDFKAYYPASVSFCAFDPPCYLQWKTAITVWRLKHGIHEAGKLYSSISSTTQALNNFDQIIITHLLHTSSMRVDL